MADNFWSMGVPGPCGPCSEIYYDRGPEYGREGGPVGGRGPLPGGLEPRLHAVPAQRGAAARTTSRSWASCRRENIDTGMGLERMAALLQGVDNIYEVDTMWQVLDRAAELTEQKYGRDHRTDVALRVVADHVRTAVMLVADGVLPSNEGRGYVLRRILRRSVRNLRLLAGSQRGGSGGSQDRGGHGERYLHELASSAIDALGDQYPELRRDAPNIHTVIDAEEAAFLGTLRTGTAIFDAAVEETRRRGSRSLAGEPGVPAARHLRLPDRPDPGDGRRAGPGGRRGRVPAADGGAAPAGQGRTRPGRRPATRTSRRSPRCSRSPARWTSPGTTRWRARRRSPACWSAARRVPAAGAGTEVEVVLDRTPFYAEGGGQLADAGVPGQRVRAGAAVRSRCSTCSRRCPA